MNDKIKALRVKYTKAVPEGPYKSPWTSKLHYLITVTQRGKVSFAVIPDGTQPTDAQNIFPTAREARAWLRDNGFERN